MAIIQKSFSDLVDFTRGSEATGWVNGQLETFGINEPRFVTDPATGYSGLLLEPFASTNLVTHSLDMSLATLAFSDGIWEDSPRDPHFNFFESGVRIPGVPTTTSSAYFDRYLGKGPGPFTWSFYVVMDDLSEPLIGGTSSPSVDFSLISNLGSVSNALFRKENLGGGKWRVLVEEPRQDGDNYFGVQKRSNHLDRGFTVYGPQLESGTRATSYIPTGDSQVTRAGDFFTLPVGDWYRPDQGTLIVTAASLVGETVATFGDIVIVSNSDEMKTYTAPYSSPIGATHLELGAGLFSSVQYYPKVLS